jgi:septal ring factor EnvC (AmiA/AmiB activator)
MANSFRRSTAVAAILVATWTAGATGVVHAEAPPCLRAPVTGVVIDPFREPACRWCAGNRGIEYRVDERALVRAVASGTVTFAGAVVGTGYVVVDLANGWRVTYGHVADVAVRLGGTVLSGSVIGRASGTFHLGLRVSGEYEDPAPFIGRLVGRARLVPVDGSPRRLTRVEDTSCRVGEPSR